MAECSHNCDSCSSSSGCSEPKSFLKKPHEQSSIRKVIGIVSGKGGVGKSLVTSMMAVEMQKRGYNAAILDADITGPSIPKAFGLHEKVMGTEFGVFPAKTKTGIDVMSVNLLLENDTDPVVWRGPIIAESVRQFWTDIIWQDVDFMFVDMPPGTGDVPLTVFQSLPVDGILIITSPQELVSMIVTKAVKMANMMNIPILGIIENYSYLECPDCGKRIEVFGKSHIAQVAHDNNLEVLAQLPIDPKLAEACDKGMIEEASLPDLSKAAAVLEKLQ